jgi:hypothetical protein
LLYKQADQQLGWSSIPRPTAWGPDGDDKTKEGQADASATRANDHSGGGEMLGGAASEGLGHASASAVTETASEAGLGQAGPETVDATVERKGGIWSLADLQLPDGFASMDD